MQSHIGCICLTFLHCAFSNVSSKCLPEWMHSHTGCIYLAFLHCAFSNGSSNRLPEKMRTHTGCICLTFLHCAFSNDSSNRLPEKMQNHIGCICLTFLHCAFSNFDPLLAAEGKEKTWIDLFITAGLWELTPSNSNWTMFLEKWKWTSSLCLFLAIFSRLGPLLVSFLQHDDDDDLEDIPTDDLPMGKSSVGILGACHNYDDNDDDEWRECS